MLISQYVENVRADLESLGRLGGDEVAALASRLAEVAGPALRARLLEALDTVVAESNAESDRSDLSLGLAGDEVVLVRHDALSSEAETPGDLTARFALRMPEDLKGRIEDLAQRNGASTNSWIVRALSSEVADFAERTSRQAERFARQSQHQLKGTGRS
jgi:predicted transcriptional regulator